MLRLNWGFSEVFSIHTRHVNKKIVQNISYVENIISGNFCKNFSFCYQEFPRLEIILCLNYLILFISHLYIFLFEEWFQPLVRNLNSVGIQSRFAISILFSFRSIPGPWMLNDDIVACILFRWYVFGICSVLCTYYFYENIINSQTHWLLNCYTQMCSFSDVTQRYAVKFSIWVNFMHECIV